MAASSMPDCRPDSRCCSSTMNSRLHTIANVSAISNTSSAGPLLSRLRAARMCLKPGLAARISVLQLNHRIETAGTPRGNDADANGRDDGNQNGKSDRCKVDVLQPRELRR